jgi:hypothetical protein
LLCAPVVCFGRAHIAYRVRGRYAPTSPTSPPPPPPVGWRCALVARCRCRASTWCCGSYVEWLASGCASGWVGGVLGCWGGYEKQGLWDSAKKLNSSTLFGLQSPSQRRAFCFGSGVVVCLRAAEPKQEPRSRRPWPRTNQPGRQARWVSSFVLSSRS